MFLAVISTQKPPQPLPTLSPLLMDQDSSGESLKTYRRSWWSLRSRGARHLESNTRQVPVNPAAGEGEPLSGEGRAQAAAEFCQAWKPGLPPRAVLGSGSNPGQSSQAAAAGRWGGLLWQLQRLRWKESSDFYFFPSEKGPLPLWSHCYCKDSQDLQPKYQNTWREVAGPTHTGVLIARGAPHCRVLQKLRVSFEGRSDKFVDQRSIENI